MLKRLSGRIAGRVSWATGRTAVMVLLVCVSVLCSGFTFAAQRVVTIIDGDGVPVQITTADTNVSKIISKQGIILNQGDKLSCALTDNIGDDAVIRIYRAMGVKVTYLGETKDYTTTETKVGAILQELGIKTDEGDEVTPALDSAVEEGAEISVVLHDTHNVTVQEDIAYQTIRQENSALAAGESRVVQEGRNGLAEYEYRIQYLDGKEVAKDLVRTARLSDPVDEIIEYGPEDVWQLGVVPASKPVHYRKVARFQATAYDASPADNGIWAGKTSTGMPLVYGVVAVDPRVIPYGTKMYIESVDGQYKYGYAIAGDCGGAIKGSRVDLFFPSRSACYQFGRRDVNIYFLD